MPHALATPPLRLDLAAVRACELTRWFGPADGARVTALPSRSFVAARGEAVALVGPSGCGKSTLLNLLGLLERPSAGALSMLGVDVLALGHAERARFRLARLGFVFQDFCLLKDRSVQANVELPLVYAGISSDERKRRAREALEKVQLADRMDHRPNELSGGQRQRVAIARALVNNPSILLADEPTGNLDSQTSEEIMRVFESLASTGQTVVMVTHEPDIAAHARRVVVLRDGLISTDERRDAFTSRLGL